MNHNKRVAFESNENLDQLKYEIEEKLGMSLNVETSARLNEGVGNIITKKIIELGKQYYENVEHNQ